MRMSKWWQNFHILAELFLAQGDSDDIWSIVGSNLQPVGYQLTSLTSRPYYCGLDWHLVSEANDLWPLWGVGRMLWERQVWRPHWWRRAVWWPERLHSATTVLWAGTSARLTPAGNTRAAGHPLTRPGRKNSHCPHRIHKQVDANIAGYRKPVLSDFLPLWGQTAPAPTKTLLDKWGSLNINEHQCFLQNF